MRQPIRPSIVELLAVTAALSVTLVHLGCTKPTAFNRSSQLSEQLAPDLVFLVSEIGNDLFGPSARPPVTRLLDRNGTTLKEWRLPAGYRNWIGVTQLLPNGRLAAVANREGFGDSLLELGPDSRIERELRYKVHHEFISLPEGSYLAITHDTVGGKQVSKIVEVDDRGIRWQWDLDSDRDKILQAGGIRELPPRAAKLLESKDFTFSDAIHPNSIQLLPPNALAANDRRFEAGNLLFSFKNLNMIGILNRQTMEVVWAYGPNETFNQHAPRMMSDGMIVLLDNGEKSTRPYSRILEIDPRTKEIVRGFNQSGDQDFYTVKSGAAWRLENSNYLVSKTETSELLEISPSGTILWRLLTRDLSKLKLDPSQSDKRNFLYRAEVYPEPQALERLSLGAQVTDHRKN